MRWWLTKEVSNLQKVQTIEQINDHTSCNTLFFIVSYSTRSYTGELDACLASMTDLSLIIIVMDKDYVPSKKYWQDELDNLDIPYKFRDFCQDDYADFVSCARTHPRLLQNNFIYSLPVGEALSSCKALRKKWLRCEQYRQKELFEQMKRIYDLQKDLV